MRFIEDGPDIPDDLIDAVAAGEVVFVCGAGVSKRAGLPLFRELVEQVYRALGEPFNNGPEEPAEKKAYEEGDHDRVLRALEKRTRPPASPRSVIREKVAEKLQPTDVPLDEHCALLRISRDKAGRHRLITTNFDTLFERAWPATSGESLSSFAAASLPAPGSPRDHGVLHLHGRIAAHDLGLEETDLILTSADFGEVYLRSGWASRYVADRLRLHTLVLVGYGADDAAMRLLLDALDADRDRFPDLKRVYAFDQEKTNVEASWKAKGVDPLLYEGSGQADHDKLYATLREWARYCDDSNAFARVKLEEVLGKEAATATSFERQLIVYLLPRHGGGKLLAEINPSVSWLGVFQNAGLIGKEECSIRPDWWIGKRLADPEAIAACVNTVWSDADLAFVIEKALRNDDARPLEIFEKAWRLIILAAKEPPRSASLDWFTIEARLARGDNGHDVQRGIADSLRPRLRLAKPWRFHAMDEDQTNAQPQRSQDLLSREMTSEDWPNASRVLEVWPEDSPAGVDDELLNELTTELERALREAEHAELIREDFDRSDQDVNSVSQHPQDEHSSGFYPIVRVMADVWERLSQKDQKAARRIADKWAESRYRLSRRLALFAASSSIIAVDDAAKLLLAVKDRDFYDSGARRETMKLMAERWNNFPDNRRSEIEARLLAGPPRELFPDDAFTSEEWARYQDQERLVRLSRIEQARGTLSEAAQSALADVQARHPAWQVATDDHDDFLCWHGGYSRGPMGDVSVLNGTADDSLIDEALALQRQQSFHRGDLWRAVCGSDPDRAIAALEADAQRDVWRVEAWRGFFWEANRNLSAQCAERIARLLLGAPVDFLNELGASVTHWLRAAQSVLPPDAGGLGFSVWDRLADAIISEEEVQQPGRTFDDILNVAINSASGHLAEILISGLAASNPKAQQGLPDDLRTRFDRLATAVGEAGLMARTVLARMLHVLYQVDPEWSTDRLLPRFHWSNPEAAAMWSARCYGDIGSAALFNALREPFLALFARDDLAEKVKRQMTERLLGYALSERLGGARINICATEVRRALRYAGTAARAAAASFLSRVLRETPADERSTRWREVVGPTFGEIWPLDADLREQNSSAHLAILPLFAGHSLPEAVTTILPYLVPGASVSRHLIIVLAHDDQELITQFPHSVIELLHATVDETFDLALHSILQTVLDKLRADDVGITNSPYYRSLTRLLQERRR